MKLRTFGVAVGSLLTLAAGGAAYGGETAAAPERGFYVGAGVGQSRAQGCDRLFAIGFTGDCDNKDTIFNFVGGYQFNRHLAAEIGYGSGDLKVNGRLGGVPFTASVEADIVEATGLAMLPIPPLPSLSLYAKAGLFYFDVDAASNFGGAPSANSDSGTDLTYGLGAQYSFTRNWAARVEWQRYRNVSSASALGDAHISAARAVVRYTF